MAINLTYDPSTDPEAIEAQEASDAEAYAIGDRLDQEQQDLLAGKYRSAEDLEKAYIELQKKFSSRNTDEPEQVEQQPEEEVEEESEIDYSFLDRLANEFDSGQFSEETLNALDNMSASEVADMFLAYRQQVSQPVAEPLSDNEIVSVKNLVGGEDQYNQLVAWASQNLSPQEIEIYDSIMDRGDAGAIYFAVQALNYRFQDSVGTEGRLLTGTAAKTGDTFRSQAEVVRAMSDPRYDSDPAYRQDVFDKLERSELNF